uniref:Uncharacterized protein n=1 Tax=Myoviridae sp. ctHMa1 TaxID=2827671 RepID=A0A8S5SGE3_9CAUD|nr:MAG TPA: hypothetical protein [Myoviridae sp. ctHMa1]
MLPARVRKMRQMEDLLNVEDIILIEIERIIDEMYGAAALLHEELVNEAWLKEKLDARTGADTTVETDTDKLLAMITLDVSKIVGVDMKDIRAFLDKWLPAHLRYRVILLIESGYISPEKYTVTGMALGYEAQFWPVRTLNGAWLLDGTYNLDAVRKADEYGLTYEIGEIELHEDFTEAARFMTAICQEENTVGMVSMGFESQFWQVPTLNGAWKLDGSVLLEILRHPHEYGQHFDFGKIENKEENDYHVRLDKDLWFLDGSQNLNGKRILDAERREEELT